MLRTIIVDDEELARRGIRDLLEQVEDVEIVGEYGNGREAIEAIRALEPDLAYLDVQMPGKDGFDVIAAIEAPHCPHIVFVTAFDDYAIRAFEVHALDYLLKPVSEQRFEASMTRARAAVGSRDGMMVHRLAQIAAELRARLPHPGSASLRDRIAVKTREGLAIVGVAEIDWVEADRDYVTLHVGKKAWLLRGTISTAESRLAPSGFLRIHRSVLVNANRVRELRALSKGEFTVVLENGTELKLSRNYRAALERLVGAKIDSA
jgi:two-component system, LytTR family, response regulator